MTTLTSLIERIEAATEGSRELDGCIYIAVNIPPERVGRIDQIDGCVGWWPKGAPYVSAIEVPRYSTSIDAALTLLPEGLEFEFTNLYGVAAVGMGINTESPCYARREDGNITLALLAAILRARQTEAPHDES